MAKKKHLKNKRADSTSSEHGDNVGDEDKSRDNSTRYDIKNDSNRKKHRLHKSQASSKSKDVMDKYSYALYILVPSVVAIFTLFYYQRHLQSIRANTIRTPLPVARVIPDDFTSAAVSPDRFWGTYRSQSYFGLKTRRPGSLVTGLMWFTQFMTQQMPEIRHWCDQGDGLVRYSWEAHDGIHFGTQEIWDKTVALRTSFVKQPGGDHGGDWTAKIQAHAIPGGEKKVVSLLFYVALDGQGSLKEIIKNRQLSGVEGWTKELGNFTFTFPVGLARLNNYLVTHAPGLDQLKETVQSKLAAFLYDEEKQIPYIGLNNKMELPPGETIPTFIVYQVTVPLPFTMEVLYESSSNTGRKQRLSGNSYNTALLTHQQAFNERFENVFKLKSKGYSDAQVRMSRSVFSNMVGSIGYFHGSSLVKSEHNSKPVNYWPAGLYTGVPSRSFFPRGFLWDEGFHNLLISKWDPQISKEIIGHWFDLINVEGWIPREQILGVEARAKVPAEFIVQKNLNANPPTFFLPLQQLVKDMIKSNRPSDMLYLRNIFPRLKVWYNWYNTTQHGTEPFTYRWRGRNGTDERQINPLTLTSGLDDYPRSSHPSDDERHVDLHCWMVLASDVMTDIATSIDEPWQAYKATYDALSNNTLLNTLYWSKKSQRYADYGLHSNKIKLIRPPRPQHIPPGQPVPNQDKVRQVLQQPKKRFVTSFGYVSLFPFLLKIVDADSPNLGRILTDLNDTNLLWTEYGLRSLAKNAALYRKKNTEHDPPYWRGAIWININYLAIRALHHYANTPGSYQQKAGFLYGLLRNNVVNNILKEHRRTGYIWENYDDSTGEGKGSHPFTGWSALVVLMMAENYD